ncbi:DUF1543 domain-containing protein [Idiomarina loihiensis]|jgi:glycyl-tRNA synthetase alpha subunit|uniref:Uncharacterized conserved protein n=1 Tax=Idiomarina loihiensis (strain ATCC BAA-735 / DSM 15497 / L2-TR) TaxID=283942 RepID=Q5QU98_IDILO|nr:MULTISPECIES: DUF1543 domain-containing protein [Idiomarina]AAV82419.1 Uncharacterized conserved protein [Idiomarina loihiensis L2TR]AGM36455.1 hypothetical protein K734_07960 [Idiomarina loihiensis GSL 199]PHQ90860.1 MAG: DUF1543 domain-containing protein [Idiomarina sp.]
MNEIDNKLFLVYVGGTAPGANIELHDIRFVVGPSMEETYPAIRKGWFGTQKGLHLDSFVHLHHVDGYRIHLTSEAHEKPEEKRLYFVNFGGYFPNKLAEYHDFTVVVADSPQSAKQLARAQFSKAGLADAEQIHKDDLLAVDDCLCVDLVDNHYVTLEFDGEQQPLVPDWKGYQPLP